MGCLRLTYWNEMEIPTWRDEEKNEQFFFQGLWKRSDSEKNCDNYYPFGFIFSSYQRENSTPNKYLYNEIERQNVLNLGWNLAQFRSYEPALGRFLQIDLVIKVHKSSYAWNTNNLIFYLDPTGADSLQRAKAMQEANRYVDQNPGGKSGYGFAGYHAGELSKATDFIGTITSINQ